MSDKGLEHIESPMYELDRTCLEEFEVSLSWLEDQPSRPELVVPQEADDASGSRLVRVRAWLGRLPGHLA